MRFIFGCSILLFFTSYFLFAQTHHKEDRLHSALKAATYDTLKIEILTELHAHFFYKDKKRSRKYIDQAIAIADNIDDYRWKIDSYNNLAYFLRVQGQFEKAIEYYSQCLKWSKEEDYSKGIIESLQGIGNSYQKNNKLKTPQ